MEDVNAYIESGILELYVLGQLSALEIAEVEAMAAKHPEVKAELSAIEIALETYALENSITTSEELELRILSQFDDEKSTITANPATPEQKIIPLYKGRDEGKIKVLRFSLVACIALLVVSLVALYSVYNRLNLAQDQIATLSRDKQQFATTVSKLQFEKSGMENRIAMVDNAEWTTVKLAGVPKSPEAKMLVFWNKTNKNVLINYAAIELPKTDKAHEYQLWALVDGKPVSLGVFTEVDNAKEAVVQMAAIQKAQAFAVTIEPTGGSINPTMEKMVVMGAI